MDSPLVKFEPPDREDLVADDGASEEMPADTGDDWGAEDDSDWGDVKATPEKAAPKAPTKAAPKKASPGN